MTFWNNVFNNKTLSTPHHNTTEVQDQSQLDCQGLYYDKSNAQTLPPQVQDSSEASLPSETEGFEVFAVEMLPWIYWQGL